MNRDTSYTLVPVNRLLRIFFLTNVKCKNDSSVPNYSVFLSFTTILTLTFVNIIVMIFKQLNYMIQAKHRIAFHNSIQSIYWLGYLEYILDQYFIFKTRFSFVKYLELYQTIDAIIRAPDFKVIRKTIAKTCIWFVIIYVLITAFDFMSWYLAYGWSSPILYSVHYLYTFMNSLVIFDVISQVTQIEYRLQIMVATMNSFQTKCDLDDNIDEEVLVHVMGGDWIRPSRLRDTSNQKVGEVRRLSKFYLLLTDQVSYINKAFGVRLLIFMLNQVITLIHMSNIILRFALDMDCIKNPSFHLVVITNTLWFILSASVQLAFVYRCEMTNKLCKKTVNIIDHIFINNRQIGTVLRSELTELRDLIRSRTIQFHAAGFFTFNYPLLASMASAIATYTIIIFQSMQ